MALKKSMKKIFEEEIIIDILVVCSLFCGLTYFVGFDLFAVAKADCFENNSFYSLVNF